MIRFMIPLLCLALGACGSKQPPAALPVQEPAPASGSAAPATAVAPAPTAQDVPAPVEVAPVVAPASPAEPARPDPVPPAERPAAEPAPARPATPAPAPARGKAELLAAETRAWEAALPVLQKYCASCHTQGGRGATKKKLDHFDMTAYPIGGHHATKIGATTREVLGLSGKKPTMPFGKAGAVAGDELAVVKAWTVAWDAADKAGAHAH
jgi:hypothetical protein